MSESTPGIGRKRAPGALKTRIHRLAVPAAGGDVLSDVVATLMSGGLVVVPTDTAYGIACSAFNTAAVRRVYALKGRRYEKALSVLIAEAALLNLIGVDVPPEASALMGRYWPGPLTLVVKTGPLAVAAANGSPTIAVRVPDHGILQKALQKAAVPIAATSANRSGQKSIVNGAEAIRQFEGHVDLIVDGGRCALGEASSIVDVTHYPFSVLREGAVSKKDLERVLGVA